MGLLDKLRTRSAGILTAAKPAPGVEPAPLEVVAGRLLAIAGRGIETSREGDTVVVSWAAKVAAADASGASHQVLVRSITVDLHAEGHEAVGLCRKATTSDQVDWRGSASRSVSWERGQHTGSETLHVVAWLGLHAGGGGADERGYRFAWSDLRDPVLDAVTGAGWTYRPKRF
jgi:hypothetical protein